MCHSGLITGAEGGSGAIVRFRVTSWTDSSRRSAGQKRAFFVFFSFPQPKRRRAEGEQQLTWAPSVVAILGTQLPGRDLAVEQQWGSEGEGTKVGEAADSPNGSTMPFCTCFNCSKPVFSNAASDSSVSFVSLLNRKYHFLIGLLLSYSMLLRFRWPCKLFIQLTCLFNIILVNLDKMGLRYKRLCWQGEKKNKRCTCRRR